jgi:hypothetical protein
VWISGGEVSTFTPHDFDDFVSDGEMGPTAKAAAKALGVTFWWGSS